MFAEGVTCGDCHEPHRPELRASNNTVCLQCHSEPTYQTSKHHFHAMGSPGAKCVSCHMPSVTYMVVDSRRDHSFRIPRPDLSEKLGVPNVCNGCHSNRTAAWAARTVEQWYGHTPSSYQRFAEAFVAGSQGSPDAPQRLAALVAESLPAEHRSRQRTRAARGKRRSPPTRGREGRTF